MVKPKKDHDEQETTIPSSSMIKLVVITHKRMKKITRCRKKTNGRTYVSGQVQTGNASKRDPLYFGYCRTACSCSRSRVSSIQTKQSEGNRSRLGQQAKRARSGTPKRRARSALAKRARRTLARFNISAKCKLISLTALCARLPLASSQTNDLQL